MHAIFIRPRQGHINIVWDFADALRPSCWRLLAQIGDNKLGDQVTSRNVYS
jgi:hypothetical protein